MTRTYHAPPPSPPPLPGVTQRLRSALRIGADYVHSCLRPVVHPAGAAPALVEQGGAGGEWPGGTLRLLIWNVHRGYGGATLAASLARLMARLDPDVLLLQEVPVYDEVRPFWRLPAIAPLLEGRHLAFTPMHRVDPSTPGYPFAESGLLTVSRWAPTAWDAFALPQVTHPKLGAAHDLRRVGLRLLLGQGKRRLAIYNVHLENTAPRRGRALQAAAVAERAAALEDVDHGVLLGGDWNAFFGGFEGLYGELAQAGFAPTLRPRTPWGTPQIDHLFHRGVVHARARRLAVAGSDHQPVAGWVRTVGGDES